MKTERELAMTGRLGRAVPAAGVVLAVLVVAFVFAPATMWGYDSNITMQVAHSMVTEGSFRVYHDPLAINLPYSSYGIGMSLLMAISELLGPRLHQTPAQLNTVINPVLLALIALVLWLSARRLGATSRQAALAALAVALASPLLPYATSTFTEVGTALGVAFGILGILYCGDRPFLGGAVAGVGLGVAGLFRPDSFLLVAPVIAIGAVLTAGRKPAAVAGVMTGALPAVAMTAFYNMVRFGSPLTMQYQGLELSDSFPYPFWDGLYGLVISPGRGLVFYAPIVGVMAIGWKWSWQRSRLLTLVCAALLADRLVFFASWWAWHGGNGWGPRFLVPAMPALLPFVVEILRRVPAWRGLRSWPRAVGVVGVAGLFAASLAVQVVGSTTYMSADAAHTAVGRRVAQVPRPANTSFLQYATLPAMLDAWGVPFMDWSLFPIKEHTKQLVNGQHLTSRYANPLRYKRVGMMLLLLLVGLAAAGYRPRSSSPPSLSLHPPVDS